MKTASQNIDKFLSPIFISLAKKAVFAMLAISTQAYASGNTLGLPPISTIYINPARIALGKTLFFDARLSKTQKIACSSCHQPENYFSDNRAHAIGVEQKIGTRNTPSLLNVAFNTSLFWDGRRPTLETQALDPLTNPREHGLKNQREILDIVHQDAAYYQAFSKAFGIKKATNINASH